jgi:hypothetical protein
MSTDIYDEAYFQKYVKLADTDLGQKIYRHRWGLITRLLPKKEQYSLLDYGCGPGSFHAMAPDGFKCEGFDINAFCGFTEVRNPFPEVLTLWDVIEHLPDPLHPIREYSPKYLFITTPNVASVSCPMVSWKHYRPKEHLYYFDEHSLTEILDYCGYKVFCISWQEGALRDAENPDAIITVVAKRVESS